MKTLLKISFTLFLLIGLSSCNLTDKLTTDIPIENQTLSFNVGPNGMISAEASQPIKVKADVNTSDVILLNQTFDINVTSKLKEKGLSLDLIKSFLITKASLEITVPDSYEDYVALLNKFGTIKLYFTDQTQLVAQAQEVTITGHTGVVSIKIVNPELLSKLSEDQLRIILTGEGYPSTDVNCTLTTSYVIKVGL